MVVCKGNPIFVSVFHRILDFKTGLYFYAGPFLFYIPPGFARLRSSPPSGFALEYLISTPYYLS